ncbi:MAG: VPLPA-CTERM sorting domain-containing protein [Pseudomonadota bacterium]
MRKTFWAALLAASSFAATAQAVTVTGATEVFPLSGSTITNGAPGSDTDMLWFKESVGSFVGTSVEGLGTTGIVAGQVIDTYMVFLNRETGSSLLSRTAKFEFSTSILGLFGEANGSDLVLTDGFGGTLSYTNFGARGIENNSNDGLTGGSGDSLAISGANNNVLDVTFAVTQPGDWVRVAVVSAVPVPAGALLLPFGLGALAMVGRRKKRKS